MSKWRPNEYEEALIKVIKEAETYCKGELEIDLLEDGWYAMDYRPEFGAALAILENGYLSKPLISKETVEKYNVDVRKCFDYCNIAYVG